MNLTKLEKNKLLALIIDDTVWDSSTAENFAVQTVIALRVVEHGHTHELTQDIREYLLWLCEKEINDQSTSPEDKGYKGALLLCNRIIRKIK